MKASVSHDVKNPPRGIHIECYKYLYESSQHVSGLPTLFCHNHIAKHSLGHVNHQPTGAVQNLKTTGPLSFKSLVRYFLQRVSSKKHLIRRYCLDTYMAASCERWIDGLQFSSLFWPPPKDAE
ncbi:uncharacterized protein LOC113782603 [Coffea eugenioides]|nr:uncharacterized protein LOC113782603 [Coffea eugenioides]